MRRTGKELTAKMPDREPLSGPDNAWRRMGTTNNLMTITGVLTFEETVSYEEMCERLESRLLRFDRFKQRVGGQKRRLWRPYWETVEEFDVENHVYELALPEPADQATFERFVGTLMSRPLDERRPLWELYLVDNVGPDEGNAAVVRINHSVGDGFALLYVMLGLVDNPEELEFPIGGVSAPQPPDESDAAPGGTVESGGDADTGGEEDSMRSEATGAGMLGTVGTAARALKTGYDLVTMPDEERTSLYGELGQTKRVAWTRQVDLERVKRIGDAHDATVNDVLVAATAGAIRRVLDERGEETRGLELRCTVPINLKPMEERTESLGNYFGIVFLPIPVGTRDLDERIDIVRERMDIRKAGIEAFLMYQLLNIAGYVPEPVQNLAMKIFEKQATGVVTNVPGPMGAAKFAGKEIGDMIFWVPQGNDQGLGISIISYNESVRIGIAADASLLPEPRLMADAFETEIDTLVEELEL
jgi:diacylglycerol O-acyltransferase